MLVFLFITILVMLNILIAKLSNTYHNIQDDAVKGLLVYRATIIARAEKNECTRAPFTVWTRTKLSFALLLLAGSLCK